MIINEKQLLALIQLAQASIDVLNAEGKDASGIQSLVTSILDQQSTELKEVE